MATVVDGSVAGEQVRFHVSSESDNRWHCSNGSKAIMNVLW